MDLVVRLREAVFQRTEKALMALGLQSRLPVTASEVAGSLRSEWHTSRHRAPDWPGGRT